MKMNSNFAAPAEFIDRIASELQATSTSWSRIGSALSEAEEVFGNGSKAFKQILKATKFSRGTATKLVKVARSERLREHAKVFAKCQAWTTLYEVTTLSEEQFAELLDSVADGEIVTFGMIRKVKGAAKEADPYKVAFTVRIDENALKGGLIDGTDFERLLDLIAQIQDTVPFIRVDGVGCLDVQSSRFMSALQHEYDRLMRSHLTTALTMYKRDSPEWKRYKSRRGTPRPPLGYFGSEEEVRLAFIEHPAEVLDSLGYDKFDQAKTYREAQIAVERKAEKFGRLANMPFQHANTIENAASSSSPMPLATAALAAYQARNFR